MNVFIDFIDSFFLLFQGRGETIISVQNVQDDFIIYFLVCCCGVLANMARNSSRLILLSPEVSQDRKIRSACSLLTFFIICNEKI